MTEINQTEEKKLKKWNLIMGILHLLQAGLMFFISKKQTFEVAIYLPKPEESGESGVRVLDYPKDVVFDVNLGYAITLFLLLSALAHFITILPRVFEWYIKNLKENKNLIRWFEYALSSSIMIFIVGALSGINDIVILMLIFASNAFMNFFGAMMELYNSALRKASFKTNKTYKVSWISFNFGVIAGAIPWAILALYFFTLLNRASEAIPNFVYWILPILFVFFNLFAVNMYLQYSQKSKWKNYLFGEKVYILLSLTAKSFLAWFIFGGTLR